MQRDGVLYDGQRINRADNVVVSLFALCTCLPSYCSVIPALGMLARVMADSGLRRRMRAVPFVACLLGFDVILLFSTLRLGDTKSMAICAGLCMAPVLMVYLRAVLTWRDIRFFLRTILWGTMVNALIAVVQSLTYDTAGGYRATALFFNPNYYSMISGFMLVCVMYQWIRHMAPKPLLTLASAAAMVGLMLSNSRTGLLSAIFGVLLLVLRMKTKRGMWYFLMGFLAVGGVLLCFPGLLRLDNVSSSLGFRTDIWQAALSGIKQRPILGQGAWSFVRITEGIVLKGEIHSHNLLLELLLSCGFAGTALMGIYLFGNLRDVARVHQIGKDKDLAHLCVAVFCMVLLHGLFDLTIFIPQNAILLMLMLAVAGWAKGAPSSLTQGDMPL